jgi:hypothetical protein
MGTTTRRRGDGAWVGIAIAVVVFLAMSGHYLRSIGPLVIDDTFVFFRYAENFARGNGFVYNAGEPAEGYTSFLWVLLLGFARVLGLDPLPVSQLLGIALGASTLLLTWLVARALFPSLGFAAALPSLFLATNRTFCVWSIEGMDAKIFGAAVMAAFACWLRLGSAVLVGGWLPLTGVLVGLLPLARPEGYLAAGLLGAFAAAEAARSGRWRGALANGAAAASIAGAHLVYRIVTYHDVVPNTFRAKVVGLQLAHGFRYLGAFLVSNHVLWYGLLTLAGAVLFLLDSTHRAQRRFAVAFCVAYAAYLAAIGGDYFEFRLVDVILPFVGLATTRGLVAVSERFAGSRGRLAAGLLGCAWLALNLDTIRSPVQPRDWLTTPERESAFTAQFEKAALWMKANLGPGESIAISPAGVIAYRNPDVYVLDLFGLNDREVARVARVAPEHPTGHQRVVDVDYVRSRGIHYFIGHPRLVEKPYPPGRIASVEVEPGLYFLLQPLQPGTKYQPMVYRLGSR